MDWIGLDVRLVLKLKLADLGNIGQMLKRRKYTESQFAKELLHQSSVVPDTASLGQKMASLHENVTNNTWH